MQCQKHSRGVADRIGPTSYGSPPYACCGRESRALLDEVLAMVSMSSARALIRLISPMDEELRQRTLPNPLACVVKT